MRRVFTRDHGRHEAGSVVDYPLHTWKNFYPGYVEYTVPADGETEFGDAPPRKLAGAGRRSRRKKVDA